jgi:hypothetical protein
MRQSLVVACYFRVFEWFFIIIMGIKPAHQRMGADDKDKIFCIFEKNQCGCLR